MHQNLLNAGFAFVDYLSARMKTHTLSQSPSRPQRCCTKAFAAYMPAINRKFRVIEMISIIYRVNKFLNNVCIILVRIIQN
jgi:hypothetical protein